MNLLVELAVLLWVLTSVSFSLWMWHDAWYLAYSRLWAVVGLILGPAGFFLYIYRSRWFRYSAQSGILPAYELRLKHRTTSGSSTKKESNVASEDKTEASDSGTWAENQDELPRCPACRTAISYYDVKCIRCGHAIGRIGQNLA
jgi:hypothetical protein